MKYDGSISDKGLALMRSERVVTLPELASHLQRSLRTVQRYLVDWKAINSYNQNGSRYTLPDIAKFDKNGLWHYKGAFFSRFGNLPSTFVKLVESSQAGLTAAEAGDLTGLRPSSFLWSLREHPALKREKYHGRYVYLSSESGIYNIQNQKRGVMLKSSGLPSTHEAIAVLVEKIKMPAASDKTLSLRLKKKGIYIESDIIHNLFVHHNLTVKKTPHSG